MGRSRTVLIVLVGWFGLSVVLCFTLATLARRWKILRKAEDERLARKRRLAAAQLAASTQPDKATAANETEVSPKL
jgi:heme exporter protein D